MPLSLYFKALFNAIFSAQTKLDVEINYLFIPLETKNTKIEIVVSLIFM
jgi:hypothetical protein